MPLHPQAEAYLAQIAGLPSLEQVPIDEARALYEAGFRRAAGPADHVNEVSDQLLPGAGLAVRVYSPVDARGTLVFLHGGGWTFGSIASHDVLCRALARRTPCRVISVDYRLAPEDPYPCGLEDAWAALREAFERQRGPIAVGGDSAGANLAAVCALRARDAKLPLAFQLLLYPATDAARDTASHRELAEGYRLTRDALDWYYGNYLGPDGDPADPEISPLRARHLAGLAPAFVTTAEFDPLRDEGEAYAARLGAAGVPVTLRRYDGQIHGFYSLGGVIDCTDAALDDAADALQQAFSR
ncbi:MAG: esterase/lipase [Microbacteriaceae bacterium]|jgi:acetyl esterase|nr:esterase/lipase [Microbacteriaceae bacterium]